MNNMEMQYITLGMSILSIIFVILTYVRNGNKDVINDVKDNNKDRIDIEVFKVQLDNVRDDVKEIRQDMREIKQYFVTYKDDIRDVAKDVVTDIVKGEMQKHVEMYHKKEK